MLLSLLFSAAVAGDRTMTESDYLNRAFRAAASGDERAARTDFMRARTLDQNDPRPLRAIFYADVKLGELQEAARVAEIYSNRYREDAAFLLDEAFVLVTLHRYESALAMFDHLSRSGGTSNGAAVRAGMRTVEKLIEARAASSPGTSTTAASPLLSQAYALERSGNLPAAAATFRSYFAGGGSSRTAWLDLAYAYSRLHEPDHAIGAFDRYLREAPHDERARLARAYQLLALGRTRDAREALVALQSSHDGTIAARASREIGSLQTTNPAPAPPAADNWLSAAYGYQRANDHVAAMSAFDSYLASDPANDRIRLAWAYEAYAAGDRARAQEAFKALEFSADGAVADSARKQLGAIAPSRRTRYAADGFSVIEYDSRFQDLFFSLDTRVLSASPGLQPYAFNRLATDSRSRTTGTAPVIFNDNSLESGLGVRLAIGPAASTYSFVELGGGVSLLGKPSSADMRIGLASSTYATTDGGARNSLDWSVASYSRYAGDIIGYAQATHDFPLSTGARFRGVFGARAVFDSQREYYNNVFELQGGIQAGTPSVALRLLGVAGSYLPFGTHTTEHRLYATFRPELILSKSI